MNAVRPGGWGTHYWPWFLIAVSLEFLLPELWALLTNSADTLSDYSWRELHVGLAYSPAGIHSAAWYVSLAAWALFVIVITMHIWWRYT